MTAQKFLPEFTFEELKAAASSALRGGGFKGTPYGTTAIRNQADLDRELDALRPSLFDAGFQPMITAKSPQGKLDILQASANNFYSGVSMADLENFHDTHPLNSRLVKSKDGKLVEEVYRAGTPDGKVPPGMYAEFLKKANDALTKARRVCRTGAGRGDRRRWSATTRRAIRPTGSASASPGCRTTRTSISPTASSRSIAMRARPRARPRVSSPSPIRS